MLNAKAFLQDFLRCIVISAPLGCIPCDSRYGAGITAKILKDAVRSDVDGTVDLRILL